jgi:hypothetical protein
MFRASMNDVFLRNCSGRMEFGREWCNLSFLTFHQKVYHGSDDENLRAMSCLDGHVCYQSQPRRQQRRGKGREVVPKQGYGRLIPVSALCRSVEINTTFSRLAPRMPRALRWSLLHSS